MATYNTALGWEILGRKVKEAESSSIRNPFGQVLFKREQTVNQLNDPYELILVRRCKKTGRFI